MIYTAWGTPVTIISGCVDRGTATIRKNDGSIADVFTINLRADGGINEIDQAIEIAEIDSVYNKNGQ